MFIYTVLSLLGSFLMTPDPVLVNGKLIGYWVAVIDNSDFPAEDGDVKILRFNKCKSKLKKDRKCEYGWCFMPDHVVSKQDKLYKSAKQNWSPHRSSVYWLDKKKNTDNDRYVLHMIDKSEIEFGVTNKELYIYQNNQLIYKLIKLK